MICGYNDDGDTLLGWSMLQDHLDPTRDLTVGVDDRGYLPSGLEASGHFRRTDWFRRTHGIPTVDLEREADRNEICLSTLEWLPSVIRGPSVYGHHTGLAAYDAYLEKLADDAELPAEDMALLEERKMVHYDAMTMVSERSNGARYLSDMASSSRFAPIRGELDTAAAVFEAAASEMSAWWDIVGEIWGDEEAHIRAVTDPGVRRRFIRHIEAARSREAEGLEAIESALAILRG